MFFFFFPYAVDEPIEKTPVVTYVFLAVNWLVFVAMFLTPLGWTHMNEIVHTLGYVPAEPTAWGLVTYAFVHGGLFHILGNTLFLFLFCPYLEQKLGRLWFVVFYVAGGALAALAHHLFTGSSEIPLVGASGAIAAVLGAFFCLRPWSDIKNLFVYWILFLFGSYRVNIPAFLYFPVFFLFDNFIGAAGVQDGGVAYWAHLGGFFFGYLLLLGLFGFSGWNEEKEPQMWIQRRARTKHLKTATAGGGVGELTMETRLAAANILNEIVGIGDPVLIVKAYHRAMARYPDLMLEPGVQERMAGMMDKGGFARDALHAYEKLIQNVPRSNAGQRAHFAAGRICAGIPDCYEKGRLYLREYLDNLVTAEQRLEAEALLKSIEGSMRAEGIEPAPMRPLSPQPGGRPAVDPEKIPANLRSPNWQKSRATESSERESADEQTPSGPMRTVAGVAANEAAPDSIEDLKIKASLDDLAMEFPEMEEESFIKPALRFESDKKQIPARPSVSSTEPHPPVPSPSRDIPSQRDAMIPTTFRKSHREHDRVKRPAPVVDSEAPFAPPPEMNHLSKRIRPRLNTLDGSGKDRFQPKGLIVALPRRTPGDWESLEGFLAHLWRCNKTEAKERLQASRGILLRDVGEEETVDAERFAAQFGVPLLIVRMDSYPNVRQPVDISSITINGEGALIMSANKRHHVKWGDVALAAAAGLRHGQADGSPLRVFDMLCREPMRSYRGWEHIGWFSMAPDTTRRRLSEGFERLLRQIGEFAPGIEWSAGVDLTAGSDADAAAASGKQALSIKLPSYSALKDYNLYLEWHAIQMGSRIEPGN